MLTEMTADAVRPVRTERLAVMNLYDHQNEKPTECVQKNVLTSPSFYYPPLLFFSKLG